MSYALPVFIVAVEVSGIGDAETPPLTASGRSDQRLENHPFHTDHELQAAEGSTNNANGLEYPEAASGIGCRIVQAVWTESLLNELRTLSAINVGSVWYSELDEFRRRTLVMGLFDDIFDDLCPSSLRIPPLQDPFPFPTITDKRPSPLEPNARTNSNIDKEAAKLTGRGKALAEAKSIGETENNELRPIHSTPRKRQKKYDTKPVPDFVQLPRPKAKVQDDNPRPFRPISVLNALHEPPPSAALFPPITPSATQVERDHRLSESSLFDPAVEESCKEHRGELFDKEIVEKIGCPKRLYLRKRTKWSEVETCSLVKGVDKFGVGKWTKILNDPDFYFSEGRNAIDLKDRYGVKGFRLK